MKKMKWALTTLAASLVIMMFASASQATVLRAFVSSTGNDTNIGVNCVQATPCKTFAVAIGAVTAGGELIALDTSGYGPVTINKAITIATIPGVMAFRRCGGHIRLHGQRRRDRSGSPAQHKLQRLKRCGHHWNYAHRRQAGGLRM